MAARNGHWRAAFGGMRYFERAGGAGLPARDAPVPSKGTRLTSFQDAGGRDVSGTARQYGDVVLVTNKVGSNLYARLYTSDGYAIPGARSGDPMNGRSRQWQDAARQVANMGRWAGVQKAVSGWGAGRQGQLQDEVRRALRDAKVKE